jgi:hypothetical protein
MDPVYRLVIFSVREQRSDADLAMSGAPPLDLGPM